MKINTQGTEVEIYGAETSEQVFQIATTAIAFETLSAKMYSDRVTAIIRELSCNAYDAHVDAGRKNKPFDVDLPTALNPEFRIRDYGKSMDDAEILQLYCTYFSSSKQNTNKQIGGFGIGSKSPFSYTQGFTVTAFQHGEKRTYSAYINENRVPAIVRLNTEATTEPDGLEVKFPVRTSDYAEFKNKAARVFEFFEPTPKVNLYGFEPVKTEYKLTGMGWKMRAIDDGAGIRIIQGMVPYHFNGPGLPIEKLHLDIFVPIGTVTPAANREMLTNEVATVSKITKILERVSSELTVDLEKELNQFKTGYEKLCYLSSMRRTGNYTLQGLVDTVAQKVLVNTDLFGNALIEPKQYPDITVMRYEKYTRPYAIIDDDRYNRNISISIAGGTNYLLTSEFVIVDMARGGQNRLKNYVMQNSNRDKQVVAIFPRVFPKDVKTFDYPAHEVNALKFIQAIGNPPVKKLSELVVPGKIVAPKTEYVWHPKYWAGHTDQGFQNMWRELDHKLTTYPDTEPVYYYMHTHRGFPTDFKDEGISVNAVGRTVDQIRSFLSDIPRMELISINKGQKLPRKCKAEWIDLFADFEKTALEFLDDNPVTVYQDTNDLEYLKLPIVDTSPLMVEARRVLDNGTISSKHSLIVEINYHYKSQKITDAIAKNIVYDTRHARELFEAIAEKYPLLTDGRYALAKFYVEQTALNSISRRGEQQHANPIATEGEPNSFGGASENTPDCVLPGREDVQCRQHVTVLVETAAGNPG